MMRIRHCWSGVLASGQVTWRCTCFAGLMLLATSGHAQLPAGLDAAQLLQQFQQQTGNAGPAGSGVQPSAPTDVTVQPASRNNLAVPPPSRLEQIMSARASAKLQQFGYDALGQARAVTIPQAGAVQDVHIGTGR